MNRTKIDSSLLASAGFDEAAQTIEVEFAPRKGQATGDVYQYGPCSKEVWESFQAAESRGKHFLSQIKPKFAATKVPPPKPEEESK